MSDKKEKLLAGAKSEILRHECRADLAENNMNRQIDFQVLEIGQTIGGYEQSRREQGPLHEDWQMEKEHFVILVCGAFMKWKILKRAHELRVDEFSEGKLIQNQNAFTGPRYRNCKMRAVVWMIQKN